MYQPPTIKPQVVPAPTDPMRERRLQLLEQLALSGPERFNLYSVISTVDNDYTTIDEDHSYADLLQEMISGTEFDETMADVISDSLKFGSCGRTACLGGHAQIVHYDETKEWISFEAAISKFELPRVACGSSVNEDHPHWKTFLHLLEDRQFDEHYCEWIISMMVVRDLIDGTTPTAESDQGDDWNDEDQLQDDGPF